MTTLAALTEKELAERLAEQGHPHGPKFVRALLRDFERSGVVVAEGPFFRLSPQWEEDIFRFSLET